MAAATKAILIEESVETVSTDPITRGEEIAQLAYSNWQIWGCPCDSDEENWGWAEQEWERHQS